MSDLANPFDQVFINKDKDGKQTIHIVSEDCGDVKLELSDTVAFALSEIIARTLNLQIEIDKLAEAGKAEFTLDMARNVIKGLAFFEAVDPQLAIANRLNGVFGAPRPSGGN